MLEGEILKKERKMVSKIHVLQLNPSSPGRLSRHPHLDQHRAGLGCTLAELLPNRRCWRRRGQSAAGGERRAHVQAWLTYTPALSRPGLERIHFQTANSKSFGFRPNIQQPQQPSLSDTRRALPAEAVCARVTVCAARAAGMNAYLPGSAPAGTALENSQQGRQTTVAHRPAKVITPRSWEEKFGSRSLKAPVCMLLTR